MTNSEVFARAKTLACDYSNKHIAIGLSKYADVLLSRAPLFSPDDFYIVWFCKTLQNWKTMLSTDKASGVYFEVTYNGDKGETYIDVYFKKDNLCVKDGETV